MKYTILLVDISKVMTLVLWIIFHNLTYSKLHRTRLNNLSINVLEYGGNVMVDPGKLDDFYLIHINLQGTSELTYEQGHISINSNEAVICTPHRAHPFLVATR